MSAKTRPTPGEMAILQVLWRRGPSTVRQIRQELESERPVGYTTILKLLQIMTVKGLVNRTAAARAHTYAAYSTEEQTQELLVGDLMDRAFGGSTGRLVLQALSTRPASASELVEIRRVLSRLELEERS